ncbi:MAG: putative porin [Colwellia sp.]|nr:putative porin [Colwellia sp.]MCW8865944.1 putative porin [Colwellia sp.]MCW9081836.1 putative porin [Colwellia sp.]
MKLSTITVSVIAIPTLLFINQPTQAQSYQSFSSIGYSKSDFSYGESKYFNLGSRYYFDKRQSLGPLKEFDYINKLTNLTVNYSKSESEFAYLDTYTSNSDSDSFSIGGEWFADNFLLGGSYSYTNGESTAKFENFSLDNEDSYYSYDASLGYLITDNFLVKVKASKLEDSDESYSFNANYNLQLGEIDYIGFSYSTDDELDFHHLSTKYFMSLSQQSYLVLGAYYSYDNGDYEWTEDTWALTAEYYFNQYTSFSAGYDKNDFYSVGINHFFNDNYSLNVGYNSNTSSDDDYNSFNVEVVAQF